MAIPTSITHDDLFLSLLLYSFSSPALYFHGGHLGLCILCRLDECSCATEIATLHSSNAFFGAYRTSTVFFQAHQCICVYRQRGIIWTTTHSGSRSKAWDTTEYGLAAVKTCLTGTRCSQHVRSVHRSSALVLRPYADEEDSAVWRLDARSVFVLA